MPVGRNFCARGLMQRRYRGGWGLGWSGRGRFVAPAVAGQLERGVRRHRIWTEKDLIFVSPLPATISLPNSIEETYSRPEISPFN